MPSLFLNDYLEAILVLGLKVDLKHRANDLIPVGSPLKLLPFLDLLQLKQRGLESKKVLPKKLKEFVSLRRVQQVFQDEHRDKICVLPPFRLNRGAAWQLA